MYIYICIYIHKIESPKSPRFYFKPKLHKEGVSRRPVISLVNCHTSKLSKYVDYHLQPIVREIPFYVKDTSDFLRQIEFVPDNSYLVSLKVINTQAFRTQKV